MIVVAGPRCGVLAVADTDHAIGQGRYFDTVTIRKAKTAFEPLGLVHMLSPHRISRGGVAAGPAHC